MSSSSRELIEDALRRFSWRSPLGASEAEIAALRTSAPGVPADCLTLLGIANGGEVDLETTAQMTWFRLWAAQEAIDNNYQYDVGGQIPGYWALGTNGGGEMLTFDGNDPRWPLYAIPFSSMFEKDRVLVAVSLAALLRRVGPAMEGKPDAS